MKPWGQAVEDSSGEFWKILSSHGANGGPEAQICIQLLRLKGSVIGLPLSLPSCVTLGKPHPAQFLPLLNTCDQNGYLTGLVQK